MQPQVERTSGIMQHVVVRDSLELQDAGQHSQVFVVAKVHVVFVGVPGIEGMVTDHVQPLSRETDGRSITEPGNCREGSVILTLFAKLREVV